MGAYLGVLAAIVLRLGVGVGIEHIIAFEATGVRPEGLLESPLFDIVFNHTAVAI